MKDLKKAQQQLYTVALELEELVDYYLKDDENTCEESQKVCLVNAINDVKNCINSVEDQDIKKNRYPISISTKSERLETYQEISDFGYIDVGALTEWRDNFYSIVEEYIELCPPQEIIEEKGFDLEILNQVPPINLVIEKYFEDAIQYIDDTHELDNKLYDLLTENLFINAMDSWIDYDTDDLRDDLKKWGCDKDTINSAVNAVDAM
jgi:hypothetical protein